MSTVTSKDGTTIAYTRQGTGPAVILVDGAFGFRAFSSPRLAELLAQDFTVYTYDRRGRGESTNTKPYAVEREIEDIDALIGAAGGSANVYGISSGACLALEAALRLGSKIKKLAMYEPPYNADPASRPAWHEYRQKLAAALDAGRPGDAVTLFMQLVGNPEDMIAGMRQSPYWNTFEAVAPTLPYDAAAMGADRTPPLDRAARATMPVLVMDGGENLVPMPFMRASATALAQAIPQGQHQTLAGQTHEVNPEVLAPVLKQFFSE